MYKAINIIIVVITVIIFVRSLQVVSSQIELLNSDDTRRSSQFFFLFSFFWHSSSSCRCKDLQLSVYCPLKINEDLCSNFYCDNWVHAIHQIFMGFAKDAHSYFPLKIKQPRQRKLEIYPKLQQSAASCKSIMSCTRVVACELEKRPNAHHFACCVYSVAIDMCAISFNAIKEGLFTLEYGEENKNGSQ